MIIISYGNNENIIQQQGQEAMLAMLSQCRKDRVLASAAPGVKEQALVSSWLLESSLRKQGIQEPFVYEKSQRGKPYLVSQGGEEVHFSLSHTNEMSVAAVSNHLVGVDVERLGRGRQTVVERFFASGERKYLSLCTGDEWDVSFTLFWTVKEAIAKCLDVNLAKLCQEVDVSGCAKDILHEAVKMYTPEIGDVYVCSFQVDGHIISCASQSEDDFSLKRC